MVRLLGKIAEKQILPTHDTILKHGELKLGTGGVGSGATYGIATGFSSVKKGWFAVNMKAGPGRNATLGTDGGIMYQSDGPTVAGNLIVAFSTVTTGYATLDWYAIGD